MTKQKYLVIGLGQFGMSLLETLIEEGMADNLVVIDNNKEKIKLIQDRIRNALILDATDSDVLKKLKPENFDVAVVSMGENFQNILFISVLLKELGVKKVIARASTKLEERILKKTGVDMVVFPEVEMGKKIANLLLNRYFEDSIQLTGDKSIFSIKTPRSMVGKTVPEIKLRERFGLNVVAITTIDKEQEDMVIPDPEYRLNENDLLIIVGNNKKIDKFTQETDIELMEEII